MNEATGAGMPDDGVTAGQLLRRAREAAGMHVATLAVSLKVPVRKLEALEEDRYDLLSDAVFVRALASSVCRTLKIDASPILQRLPQGGKPRLVQSGEGINAPFRAPGDGPQPGWGDQLTRPVGLAVAALLIGALAIVLWPNVRTDDLVVAAKPEASMPPGTPPVVTPMIVPPITEAASAPVAPASVPVAAASVPVAVAAAPVAVASAAPVSAPAASAPDAGGIVVFKATGQSWVQVTDARGNSVLRKLLEPGETAGASGSLPLTVTVGSVKSTEVQVRGQPYDLGPVSRDNVARFEVK